MTKEEAIEILGHVVPFATQNGEKIAEAIDMAIEALQTDLVRCKDCYHYGIGNCYMYGGQMNEDDYCSRAERKDK